MTVTPWPPARGSVWRHKDGRVMQVRFQMANYNGSVDMKVLSSPKPRFAKYTCFWRKAWERGDLTPVGEETKE